MMPETPDECSDQTRALELASRAVRKWAALLCSVGVFVAAAVGSWGLTRGDLLDWTMFVAIMAGAAGLVLLAILAP